MRTRPFFPLTAAVLAMLAAVLPPAPARAADGPSADAQERSSQLYRKARALQMEAKWAEAEAAYQAAWDLRKTFDIAGNLGDCELHVSQPREAAEHLTYALANFPAGGTQQQKDALNQRLQEARRQVGTLHVRTSPSGAAVFVDGRPVEDLPNGVVFVNPGARTVEARLQGYGTARTTIDAAAGSEQEVALSLVQASPSGGPDPTPPRRSLVPGIVLASVGGAVLATGIGLAAAYAGKKSDADSLSASISSSGGYCNAPSGSFVSQCSQLHGATADAQTFGRASVGMLVGGAALLAASGAYFLWPQSTPKPTSGMTVGPVAMPGGAAVLVQGSF
jgi:hypothetical protein